MKFINLYKNNKLNEYTCFFDYYVLRDFLKAARFSREEIKDFFEEKQKVISLDDLNDKNSFNPFYVRKIKKISDIKGEYDYYDEDRYVIKPVIINLDDLNFDRLIIGGKLYKEFHKGELKEIDNAVSYMHLNIMENIIIKGEINKNWCIIKTDGLFYEYLITKIKGEETKNEKAIKNYYEDYVKNLINLYLEKKEEKLGCRLDDAKDFQIMLKDTDITNKTIVSFLNERKYSVITNHPNFIITDYYLFYIDIDKLKKSVT